MPVATDSLSTVRILKGQDVTHISKKKVKVKAEGNDVIVEWEEDYYIKDDYTKWTPTGASATAVVDAIAAFLDT